MATPRATEPRRLTVGDDDSGTRLDAFLVRHFTSHSRVQLRGAILAGGVTVDGKTTKVAYRLRPGQVVEVVLVELPKEPFLGEDIPLDVLYEDEDLAVVNKPAAMVVHPGKGHYSGTLVAGLQFRFENLSQVGGEARPGIVHRLDRDTTGVIVVAKNDASHHRLAEQFQARTVEKQYLAIVCGRPDRDRDRIDQPIGAHPYQREKMAIRHDHPTVRQAETFYEVLERLGNYAVVRVQPKTGRTHQIRVHLSHIGLPVLCDKLYSGRSRITRGEIRGVVDETIALERQALHARRLCFDHPSSGARMQVEAPLPPDMQQTIELLRAAQAL